MQLQEPVRGTALPAAALAAGSSGAADAPPPAAASGPRLGIPKELWRLVDALWTGGALREKGLFAEPGDAVEVGQL